MVGLSWQGNVGRKGEGGGRRQVHVRKEWEGSLICDASLAWELHVVL